MSETKGRYTLTTHVYENLEPDDPDEEEPTAFHRNGYSVFSTIEIGQPR